MYMKLYTHQISKGWHSAHLSYQGRTCIGFGATVQQAIADCFHDYQIIARLND